MNHRAATFAKRRAARVTLTLCSLCLGGSMALAAKPEWPQRYNAGVTAYESNDFAQAATSFETATASADRSLQQRALYNLGNTSYRLGQEQPAQAQQLWEHALKDYEGALALNPQDADAKFNRDFVKRKLEELKKQQQQQQQNQKNQQDKQKEQEKQQGQQKDQNQQQPNAKNQQSEQQKQQQAQEQQKQQEEQAKQQAATKPQQNPPEKGGQPENYEKMQATALLNDLRENERNWNFFPEAQMKDLKDSGKPAKDW